MSEYGKEVAKKMSDYMGNIDSVDKEVHDIQHATKGVEVRGALAAGVSKAHKVSKQSESISDDTKRRQDSVEQQFDDLQKNYTEDSPSNAEIVAARTNTETGDNHTTVGRRMDAEYKQVTAQLEEKASKNEMNKKASKQELATGLAPKANQDFVDAQIASIVSGAPKGTFANLQALKKAYPKGEEGIFLVLSDGHWYYWNETESDWLDGGQYQANPWSDFMTEQNEKWVI